MALQPEVSERPEVRALVREAQTLMQGAAQFRITRDKDYVDAAELLKQVKGKQKELKAMRESITKPMNAALKAVRELFTQPESTLSEAEDALKQAMIDYNREQERLRKQQQHALDEQAARERADLAARAAQARARGDDEEAAELSDRAAMIVAPIVPHEVPRVAGISQREPWYAEVHDLRALVVAVAEGRVPLAAVQENSSFLNGQARALREELRYPGVRAVPERSIAAGSA